MNIIIFSIVLILCLEILIFFKTPFFFKNQINLYKKLFTQINNEEAFYVIAKDIFFNSLKLFLQFLIAIIPIFIFLLLLKFSGSNIYEFIFSVFNLSISILAFLLYFFLRKKFDKKKI